MASDNFTDDDGTALATHDPNWADLSSILVSKLEIQSNQCWPTGDWDIGGARYTASNEEYSKVLVVGSANGQERRRTGARGGAATQGYEVGLVTITGGNYTNLRVTKDGVYLGVWSVSADVTVNHYIAIATSGTTTVTIRGWLDDVEQTPSKSDSSSPIGGPGNPSIFSEGFGSAAAAALDDWTDGAAPGHNVPQKMDTFGRRRRVA